jgi:zinc/manganese transport system permease protein
VIKMAVLYSVIGLLHWRWRKPFLAISTQHEKAASQGYNLRLWDFLFYGTFGVVVTSSVAIAGVLLVFSFLIVPSVSAMLLSEKIGTRLAIGWVMGVLVSLVGIVASYQFDMPTGATVVCAFGAGLVGVAGVKALMKPGLRTLSQ